MKPIVLLSVVLPLAYLFGGSHSNAGEGKQPDDFQPLTGEAKIRQSWQGDYPVAQLQLFPEQMREQPVGYIGDANVFERIWKAFKPGDAVPDIDFKTQLVLFVRNTQFYNRILIGEVIVTNGAAELLAMETRSALPIVDKVALALAVVARKGITGIQSGDETIPVKNKL